MDVLSDLLQRSHARGAAFSHSTLRGAWGVEFPMGGTLAIHTIIDGEMFAWSEAIGEPIRVSGGDVILLRSSRHFMASEPNGTTTPFAELLGQGSRRLYGGVNDLPVSAEFCCGAYVFEGDLSRSLLEALPPIVRLRPKAGSSLRAALDLMIAEMQTDAAGQQALLDRLLDVILVQALREWFGESTNVPPWLRAMDDPDLAPALQAIHSDPKHPWTVAQLATICRQSRSAFARRFTETLGQSPLQYLTQWRVALAMERLRDTNDGLAAIATDVGYGSEFSFAAAFKRHTGVAPGRWRSAIHAAARPPGALSARQDDGSESCGGWVN